MDGDVIFWLVVVALAVLQGVGAKKKQQQRKGPPKPPSGGGGRPQPPRETRPAPIPERERVELSSGPSDFGTPADHTQAPGKSRGESSSEGMLPSEIWDEILGLAQGKPPQSEPTRRSSWDEGSREGAATLESSSAGARSEAPPSEVEAFEELEARRSAPREEVGEESPGSSPDRANQVPGPATAGAIFESRLASSRPPVSVVPDGSGSRVRKSLFGSGSPAELRKAIILKEVLEKPLALRE